jgi:phospholipid/cholesterol/gamma-HCH transport system ATP-binding protein
LPAQPKYMEEQVNGGDLIIVVRELRRRFDNQQVLDGVNLDCPRGTITTIVGSSGCGKTVLLKHLTLLLRPDSGQIIIDGVDVTRVTWSGLDQVRRKLGVLFQAGALFDSMTVFDNMASR